MTIQSDFEGLLHQVSTYYTSTLTAHGVTPRGADWSSVESQELRFAQLLRLCEGVPSLSINDIGCGYGALVSYLDSLGKDFRYFGVDVSPAMIEAAKALHGRHHNCHFAVASTLRRTADFSVASGIFNVKLGTSSETWLEYILATLNSMAEHSLRGFAFNCLTKYSDRDRIKDYLYYADPAFLFDYCKTHFSRNVALLHDYGLYEFTMIVRKSALGQSR
jgi:SAM-dependent methyltransferase